MNIEDNHTILYSLLSHIFYECCNEREPRAPPCFGDTTIPPIGEGRKTQYTHNTIQTIHLL